MPEIMTILGYKIYFWLNEGKPLEPIHVHVSKKYHKNATKIWITKSGKCVLANNNDKVPTKDLKKLIKAIELYQNDIKEIWQSKFGKITYYDKTKSITR